MCFVFGCGFFGTFLGGCGNTTQFKPHGPEALLVVLPTENLTFAVTPPLSMGEAADCPEREVCFWGGVSRYIWLLSVSIIKGNCMEFRNQIRANPMTWETCSLSTTGLLDVLIGAKQLLR